MEQVTRFSDIARAILSDAQRVDTMANTVSSKLLELYKAVNDAEAFDNACLVAETDYKAARAKAKKDTALPRCWSQAKSDIKGAAKAGVDVSQFDTVSSLKKAKIAVNKAAKGSPNATAKGSNVATIPSGVDSTTLAVNKVGTLLELLNSLPDSMRDVLLDSFIGQTDKAIEALQSEEPSAPVAMAEAV